MNAFEYDEPIFRPPSEAYALIFQVTIGCSWNRCAFCQMYSSKKFRRRKESDIFLEIEKAADQVEDPKEFRRVFLADGDALILSTKKLLSIFRKLKECFPNIRRISSYALPKNILKKSSNELSELNEAGLKLIYVGIESGDDEILRRVNKGETFQSTVDGLIRAKRAKIKSSVMILNGLGGTSLSNQHALNSAKILNLTQPEFLSLLSLMFPMGMEPFIAKFGPDYRALDLIDTIREIKIFMENLELESTVFRSDHASNYLILKGVLSKDKNILLQQIERALENPEDSPIRAEWQRGL